MLTLRQRHETIEKLAWTFGPRRALFRAGSSQTESRNRILRFVLIDLQIMLLGTVRITAIGWEIDGHFRRLQSRVRIMSREDTSRSVDTPKIVLRIAQPDVSQAVFSHAWLLTYCDGLRKG